MAQPTDFFNRQKKARTTTVKLVLIYLFGAFALSLLPYVVCVVLFDSEIQYDERGQKSLVHDNNWWNPDLFLWTAGVTLLVIGCASLVKRASLAAQSGALARDLGGERISRDTRDPHHRQFINVVEEMCLSAAIPVPELYVLTREPSINAFAFGNGEDALIGVTQGALDHFTREELQGVIAHELGHIRNEDTRLNMRLISLAFGLFALTIVGRVLIYSAPRSRGDKNNAGPVIALAGIVVLLCGCVGIVFGQLMQAAVSRQREHLADADATQLTRNPQALANALKRIGGFALHGKIQNPKAMEASHLFFAKGVSTLFATHPPLPERIRALEPNWDGKFIVPRSLPPRPLPQTPPACLRKAGKE